ncbi:MAG TPA: LamG domain-containing protein [Planctomycetota bacterium]|nr:LamG domain-containing protein [Planctomycetota bacterium]
MNRRLRLLAPWCATVLAAASPGQCVVGVNSALAFASPQTARTPATTTLASATDLTVEACVRVDAVFGEGVFVQASPVAAVAPRPFRFGVTSFGVLSFRLDGASFAVDGTTPLQGTGWRHVAAVRDFGFVRLYVDGVQDGATATFTGALPSALVPIWFGRDAAGAQLLGALDDVRLWTVARTPSDLLATRFTPPIGGEPGLVGAWRFDEGAGQFAANSALSTGPALDATLGATPAPGIDDPTWTFGDVPPSLYCAPCPAPPCGQVNAPCASLTLGGVGANAQGPLTVVAAPGSVLVVDWTGPPGRPVALFASAALVPGRSFFTPAFVVDLHLPSTVLIVDGATVGPPYVLDASGHAAQTWVVPTPALGIMLFLQGLVDDAALTCSGGLGAMTTASFALVL